MTDDTDTTETADSGAQERDTDPGSTLGMDDYPEFRDDFNYWLTRHGPFALMPYIFYKYKSDVAPDDIYYGPGNFASYYSYVLHRYEVIMGDLEPSSNDPAEE